MLLVFVPWKFAIAAALSVYLYIKHLEIHFLTEYCEASHPILIST